MTITVRQMVLEAARHLEDAGKVPWSPADILRELREVGVEHNESSVRTHITPRTCIEANDNDAVTHPDVHRVGHGEYRLVRP